MTAEAVAVVHPDADVLAAAVAARLITALIDAQTRRGSASVVVPGGTIGIKALTAVSESPAHQAVDWRRVDVWWGDERFVAADSPDRNELQAREALLDALDLDPARVHPIGALGGPDGDDADAAAARYAAELTGAVGGSVGGSVAGAVGASSDGAGAGVVDGALFDVLILGMGPEGHTASIFPDSPAAHDDRAAFAVYDCPKPPPTRISMSFATIQSARAVWMVASGAEKAPAVARALGGADQVAVPAAGARGLEQTLWLLDRDAASQL